MTNIPRADHLYGRATMLPQEELIRDGITAVLHPEVVAPFLRLRKMAAREGIDLQIASGYRDFSRQLMIWNRKATGETPVLDDHGEPVKIDKLSSHDRIKAILRWSSLPGASRHHWGTDIDVYDAAAVPEGYKVQLTLEESRGVFQKLHQWLDRQILRGDACGFFRPYAVDRGGIAPEPWHLSYSPLAIHFQQAFSVTELGAELQQSDIALREEILANLNEIFKRYIEVPLADYPSARQ